MDGLGEWKRLAFSRQAPFTRLRASGALSRTRLRARLQRSRMARRDRRRRAGQDPTRVLERQPPSLRARRPALAARAATARSPQPRGSVCTPGRHFATNAGETIFLRGNTLQGGARRRRSQPPRPRPRIRWVRSVLGLGRRFALELCAADRNWHANRRAIVRPPLRVGRAGTYRPSRPSTKGPTIWDDAHAATRLPAQDLERARVFYREKLGLEPTEERPGGITWISLTGSFRVTTASWAAPVSCKDFRAGKSVTTTRARPLDPDAASLRRSRGVPPRASLVASWPKHRRPSRRQGRARDRSQGGRSRRSLRRRRRS
jgi:hypothetical protein